MGPFSFLSARRFHAVSLRTVIFVDGQNFKSNLQEFSYRSDNPNVRYPEYRLDEKHFDWTRFFLGVVEKFNQATHLDHTLIRAYWYTAETITPFPQARDQWIQDIITSYSGDFPELSGDRIHDLARGWWEREREFFQNTRSRIFEDIQRRTDFLEFQYTGQYVVRPFDVHRIYRGYSNQIVYQGRRVGEKGVDVGIAVDMISKLPSYDAGILISGDADYIPAVLHIKNQLKNFYQFSLAKGIPPRIHHLSPWLRGVVDSFQSFNELELVEQYLDRSSGIPPYIMDSIDARLLELKGIAGS